MIYRRVGKCPWCGREYDDLSDVSSVVDVSCPCGPPEPGKGYKFSFRHFRIIGDKVVKLE